MLIWFLVIELLLYPKTWRMSHTMFPRTAVEAVARDKKQKVIFDNMSLDYLLLTRYLLKVSRQQILNYVNTTFYLSST